MERNVPDTDLPHTRNPPRYIPRSRQNNLYEGLICKKRDYETKNSYHRDRYSTSKYVPRTKIGVNRQDKDKTIKRTVLASVKYNFLVFDLLISSYMFFVHRYTCVTTLTIIGD